VIGAVAGQASAVPEALGDPVGGLIRAGLLLLIAATARSVVQRGAAARRRQRITGAAQPGGGVRARLISALRPRKCPRWAVPELLLLPTGALLGRVLESAVPLLAAAVAVWPLHRRRLVWKRGREERLREAAILEFCTALAAELRTGAVPGPALETVLASDGPTAGVLRRGGVHTAELLAAARFGGDVPEALRGIAELPGAAGTAAVAACWQVATESGAGLAAGLDRVAAALAADSALRETVRGELAGPRTTAVLLAALPVFGLLLGTALGADPLHMLLHTPAGLGCLLIGVALEVAGLIWTARIVRGAETAS
jgi:tight adherence protein B